MVDLRRVPLGVDLATFHPAPHDSRPGPARLVYAGRLSPEKNPAAVVGAMRVLAETGRPACLDVYGDGPALTALRRQARDLPVTFHGYVGDRRELAGALSRADVAFAPSVAETFGLSILEAMACGTPVVTSATGGAPELLAPGAGVPMVEHDHDAARPARVTSAAVASGTRSRPRRHSHGNPLNTNQPQCASRLAGRPPAQSSDTSPGTAVPDSASRSAIARASMRWPSSEGCSRSIAHAVGW